ncbi:MAG: hypothetical protein WCL39_11310, partial [Armatimonadota bacterium]
MSAGYLILVILAGLTVGGSCVAAADNPTEVRSDDGYVIDTNTQTGDREWTLGTSRAQKTLTLRGGSFLLTSFLNKGTSPPKEYIQGPPSPEFRVPLDGKQITGADGSWVCKASSIQKLAQGEIQLEIVLAKAPLLVTKRYIVYPGCSIIREQITYENTGKDAVKITNPSFLDASVMAQDIKGGLSFGYFTGGAAGEGSQMLVVEPVKADYSRT